MKLKKIIKTRSKMNLVLEFIEGQILLSYLKEKKKLNEADSRKIFKQLLAAVSYCHSKNIAHRDIKLENIIIDPNTKIIKLIDFGFSVR